MVIRAVSGCRNQLQRRCVKGRDAGRQRRHRSPRHASVGSDGRDGCHQRQRCRRQNHRNSTPSQSLHVSRVILVMVRDHCATDRRRVQKPLEVPAARWNSAVDQHAVGGQERARRVPRQPAGPRRESPLYDAIVPDDVNHNPTRPFSPAVTGPCPSLCAETADRSFSNHARPPLAGRSRFPKQHWKFP